VLALSWSCNKNTETDNTNATAPTSGDDDAAARKPRDSAQTAHDVAARVAGSGATDGFGVKSAKIVFALKGFDEGTEEAWIDGHGATVVVKRTLEKPMKQDSVTIWKDDKNTMWSTELKKVQVTRLRSKATELRLISTNDPRQFEMAGYEKKPTEQVAGKDCDVWHSPKQNVTIWRWQGIDLKYDNGAIGRITQSREATSVETDVTLPDDLLKYPDGYEVSDMTQKRR
jgi:hypothetical protein